MPSRKSLERIIAIGAVIFAAFAGMAFIGTFFAPSAPVIPSAPTGFTPPPQPRW